MSAADEQRSKYIAGLTAIVENDPIAGPLFKERAALQQEIEPQRRRISDLTNQINNVGSKEARAALNALRGIRPR